MNTIGDIFRVTTFGESHGVAVGGVIDGCPSGVQIDKQLIASDLARRATGTTSSASQRREADEVEFFSGLLDGVTLGTPIAFIIRNTDAHPEDYQALKDHFRPSHADYTYQHLPRHPHFVDQHGIRAQAQVKSIGGETDPEKIETLLQQCRAVGDSVGGIVHGSITGIPAGLGEPMVDKFQACLAKAMFSIPAVKGFEYGDGFAMAAMKGSEANDEMKVEDNRTVKFLSNHSGGIQGGITNGEEVFFNVAFKPIPTIGKGNRHDVCALPRAAVVVEAMAALTTIDLILRNH